MLPSDPFARPESRHTMHPLLKRILVHGVLVAVLLGAMGYGLNLLLLTVERSLIHWSGK